MTAYNLTLISLEQKLYQQVADLGIYICLVKEQVRNFIQFYKLLIHLFFLCDYYQMLYLDGDASWIIPRNKTMVSLFVFGNIENYSLFSTFLSTLVKKTLSRKHDLKDSRNGKSGDLWILWTCWSCYSLIHFFTFFFQPHALAWFAFFALS